MIQKKGHLIAGAAAAGMAMAMASPAHADFLANFDNFRASARTESESEKTTSGFAADRPGFYSVQRPLIFTVGGVKMTMYRQFNGTFDIIDNTLASQRQKGINSEGERITNWGSRSIDSFSDTRNAPFVINFEGADPPGPSGDFAGPGDANGDGSTSPVGAASVAADPTGLLYFSLIAGDYGQDRDFLQMEAWSGRDGTGERLGVVTHPEPLPATDAPRWTEQRFHFAVADEDSDRIRSIRFFGGANDIDVFIDRFAGSLGTHVVPETSEIDGPLAEIVFDSNLQLIPEPAAGGLMLAGALALTHRRRERR